MTNELLTWEKEISKPDKATVMIAGFHQWANAGNVSSGIPEYLISSLRPKRIAHIQKGDFYIFQLPGNHFMFRPPVKYSEGFEVAYQEEPPNDLYYTEVGGQGLVIFIGTEPNQHEDIYMDLLLEAAKELKVKRIIVPEGVGGEVPFEKERLVSCTYSLQHLKDELKDYAVSFSNYDRNATIGMVVNHYCKLRGIESIRMSARTPSYEIPVTIPSDKRAMYDILRRIRFMCGFNLDFTDLEKEIRQQIFDFKDALKRLYIVNPELEPQITSYLEQVGEGFKEVNYKEPTNIPDVFLKGFEDIH